MPCSGRSSRVLTRLLGDHLVDGEVLAHIAQEVDEPVGAEPFGVVEQQPARLASGGRHVEQATELGTDRLEVRRQLLASKEGPLGRLPTRVTDHPGPAPGEQDRAVPGLLQTAQGQDAEEVADMQAVGGRVEPGVGRRLAGSRAASREPRRSPGGRAREKPGPRRSCPSSKACHSRQARGRLRPRARREARRSPCGRCARRPLPGHGGRRGASAESSWRR